MALLFGSVLAPALRLSTLYFKNSYALFSIYAEFSKMNEAFDSRPADAENAAPGESLSIFREFLLFLKEEKKWWLTPMIAMTILLGAIVILGGTPAGAFIYSLF